MLPAMLKENIIKSPNSYTWFVSPAEQDTVKFEDDIGASNLKSQSYADVMQRYTAAGQPMLEVIDGGRRYGINTDRILTYFQAGKSPDGKKTFTTVQFKGTQAAIVFGFSPNELNAKMVQAGYGKGFLRLETLVDGQPKFEVRNFAECQIEVGGSGAKVSRREDAQGGYFPAFEVPHAPDKLQDALAKGKQFVLVARPV